MNNSNENPFQTSTIDELEKEIHRRTLVSQYYEYVQDANPGFIPSRLHEFLCDEIQKFIENPNPSPAFDVLLISVPPQHGKSLTITETLPSWYLGKNPSHDVIIASYNEDTAQRFGRRNRDKLEQYAQTTFLDYIPRQSPWSNTEFESSKKGRCLSRGILSGITSNPAHLFIIDDPIKNREEADSPTQREKIILEYYSTIRTRIKPHGKLIVIQTRWHEEDLFGYLEKTVDPRRMRVLNLPCECEDPKEDLLRRSIGESLCPEIGRGNAWLADFKAEYAGKQGRRAWFALYQGRPAALEGNIIEASWWQYYDYEDLPAFPYKIISVDAAFKDGDDNDYVVAQVWGKINNHYYLLDQDRGHYNFVETLNVIRKIRVSYPDTLFVLIEDKANGTAIINVLSDEMEGIIPVEPSGGKVSRANAVTPAIESKRVFIPRHGYFTKDFVAECSTFPNGAHDDQVDAMTQALHRMIFVDADEINKKEVTYREWKDDMWEDYDNAGDELKQVLLGLWGYPEEWKMDD